MLRDGARVDASASARTGTSASSVLMDRRGWRGQLANAARAPRVSADVRVASAIAHPSRIICIGLNYIDHARETGATIPKEPIIFFKATTAFSGPGDPLILPARRRKDRLGGRLSGVIGKLTRYVSVDDALSHTLPGLRCTTIIRSGPFKWSAAGNRRRARAPTALPRSDLFSSTVDEMPNFGHLPMWLDVNGQRKQQSNTSNVIPFFDVPFLVSYVSQFMTLLGSVISTGTPAGVELAHKPPQYLRAGDVVAWGIEGLGEPSNE